MILPVVCPITSKSSENAINQEDEGGYTPLCLAALLGHQKAIELLLQYGADVNQPSARGSAPLHLAAMYPTAAHGMVLSFVLSLHLSTSVTPYISIALTFL